MCASIPEPDRWPTSERLSYGDSPPLVMIAVNVSGGSRMHGLRPDMDARVTLSERGGRVAGMETDRRAKRAEYQRRMREALIAGGRVPSSETWKRLLAEARDASERQYRRMTSVLTAEPSPYDSEPVTRLLPGHVAVPADVVLGLEVEISDMGSTRESIEQQCLELLALISRANIEPGCGETDLFALERALETGVGLPRDADIELLEVVRELIRWRAAAKRGG